jgi:predicted amidohydrolase YtcJ
MDIVVAAAPRRLLASQGILRLSWRSRVARQVAALALAVGLAGPPGREGAWAQTVPSPPQAASPVTRVFVARKIITMDGGNPTATAVAVRERKIVSVGSWEQMLPWFGGSKAALTANTDATTFRDRVLLPGFIEPHQHPLVGGLAVSLPYVGFYAMPTPHGLAPGLPTKAAVLARMKSLADSLDRSGQKDVGLLTWGNDEVAQPGGLLTGADLEAVSTTRAVAAWSSSEHIVVANAKWIAQAGIKAPPADGRFVGPVAAGEALTPLVAALNPSTAPAAMKIFDITPDSATQAVQFVVHQNQLAGVTTMSDLDFGNIDFDFEMATEYRYFLQESTPARISIVSDGLKMVAQHPQDPIEFAQGLSRYNTDKVVFNGVKFFFDDAFMSLGMQLGFPGYVNPNQHGTWNSPLGQSFVNEVLPWWRAGFDVHVHSNGDLSQDNLLDALAALQALYPRVDHRFTFEHYGISRPDQARRLRALGGLASVNIYYLYLRAQINESLIGEDRSDTTARLRSLVSAGVPTALHSDFPIAVPRPLLAAWIAANRLGYNTGSKVFGPDERLTLEQALRAITIDAAFVLRLDAKVGSIEPGKFADFAVLDADPYEKAAVGLAAIKVCGTVLGGAYVSTGLCGAERSVRSPPRPN